MSTPQEYWDACLIRTWRQGVTLIDTFSMFYSITKIKVEDVDPPLLRLPPKNYPWKMGVRFFVAEQLSKISARLWEQPPEKDVVLLKKLKGSKYDTEKERFHDSDLTKQKRAVRTNLKRQEFTTRAVSERNSATNWNVVK